MIALTAHSEILLKLGPTDLRKSFDGLCGLVRNEFGREPTDVRSPCRSTAGAIESRFCTGNAMDLNFGIVAWSKGQSKHVTSVSLTHSAIHESASR